jgi:integrase
LKLKEITHKQYQDALNDLSKRGFALNTLDGAHRTGRMIFKKAKELDLIKKDPTEFAIVARPIKSVTDFEDDELPKYLERDELKTVIRTSKEVGLDQDYILFMLLAYTGMRAGELCALKWSDIDFEEQTISINKTYYNPTNNSKEFTLLTHKTRSSKRVIDIDDTVIKLLKKHKAFQNKIIMNKRDMYYEGNFVFSSIDKYPGYPFYIKKIENRMKRLLKLANLNPKLTPHSLRHTHTSLLAEAGVSLELIMNRLGHEDEKTTRSVYLHVTKNMKKEASIKFSKLMKDL